MGIKVEFIQRHKKPHLLPSKKLSFEVIQFQNIEPRLLAHVCQFFINKGTILWLKSEFTGHIVSKFDLGLLNTYKLMYFDKNINGNK